MSPGSVVATAGRVLPGDAAEACPGMFTVCPKCALTLVVTAADLRVEALDQAGEIAADHAVRGEDALVRAHA